MTDFQPNFALGENVLKNTDEDSFALVELASNVAPGQVVKVTGINSDGTEIVTLIAAESDDIKYMIMEAGVIGELARVLHKGRTKATFGAGFAVGARLQFTTASKVIATTATKFTKAVAVDAAVADDDEGFIDFDGGITPLGVASS